MSPISAKDTSSDEGTFYLQTPTGSSKIQELTFPGNLSAQPYNYPLRESSTQTEYFRHPLTQSYTQTNYLQVINVSIQTEESINILTSASTRTSKFSNINRNIPQNAKERSMQQKKGTRRGIFLYSIDEYIDVFNQRKQKTGSLIEEK